MKFNPTEEEINFVNNALTKFNDEKYRKQGLGRKLMNWLNIFGLIFVVLLLVPNIVYPIM